jgi:hypothetical protein
VAVAAATFVVGQGWSDTCGRPSPVGRGLILLIASPATRAARLLTLRHGDLPAGGALDRRRGGRAILVMGFPVLLKATSGICAAERRVCEWPEPARRCWCR